MTRFEDYGAAPMPDSLWADRWRYQREAVIEELRAEIYARPMLRPHERAAALEHEIWWRDSEVELSDQLSDPKLQAELRAGAALSRARDAERRRREQRFDRILERVAMITVLTVWVVGPAVLVLLMLI